MDSTLIGGLIQGGIFLITAIWALAKVKAEVAAIKVTLERLSQDLRGISKGLRDHGDRLARVEERQRI